MKRKNKKGIGWLLFWGILMLFLGIVVFVAGISMGGKLDINRTDNVPQNMQEFNDKWEQFKQKFESKMSKYTSEDSTTKAKQTTEVSSENKKETAKVIAEDETAMTVETETTVQETTMPQETIENTKEEVLSETVAQHNQHQDNYTSNSGHSYEHDNKSGHE